MARLKAWVKSDPRLDSLARSSWTLAMRARRPQQLRGFLAGPGPRRVILGAADQHRDGWLSTDLLPKASATMFLDATRPFPFPTASIDRLLSEHMIEHMEHAHGVAMLEECRRVLRPGGRIRLATPNLDTVMSLGAVSPGTKEAEYVAWSNEDFGDELDESEWSEPAHTINRMFHEWGHRYLYSPDVLRRTMERTGFSAIERVEVGSSSDPDFDGIDFHGETIPDRWNRFETMVFEADA